MTIEDTVTGQCDHIVGLFLDPYVQYGGYDRLVRQSEGLDIDELFKYCPCCGLSLQEEAGQCRTSEAPFSRLI